MNFEYNGNLLEEDRINLVAKEIVHQYSQVSFEKAKEAAMLEGRISSSVTINDKLSRLYNIMLVNRNDKYVVSMIYPDFMSILRDASLEEYENNYVVLADEINNYLLGDKEFPLISDYQ